LVAAWSMKNHGVKNGSKERMKGVDMVRETSHCGKLLLTSRRINTCYGCKQTSKVYGQWLISYRYILAVDLLY